MRNTFISFYLRANRIHVHMDSLRGIGCPGRICLMMDSIGRSLILAPYEKTDFKSHRVPNAVYNGDKGMEISSYKLCHLVADRNDWNPTLSYRIPGIILPEQKLAVFDMSKAETIEKNALCSD